MKTTQCWMCGGFTTVRAYRFLNLRLCAHCDHTLDITPEDVKALWPLATDGLPGPGTVNRTGKGIMPMRYRQVVEYQHLGDFILDSYWLTKKSFTSLHRAVVRRVSRQPKARVHDSGSYIIPMVSLVYVQTTVAHSAENLQWHAVLAGGFTGVIPLSDGILAYHAYSPPHYFLPGRAVCAGAVHDAVETICKRDGLKAIRRPLANSFGEDLEAAIKQPV